MFLEGQGQKTYKSMWTENGICDCEIFRMCDENCFDNVFVMEYILYMLYTYIFHMLYIFYIYVFHIY